MTGFLLNFRCYPLLIVLLFLIINVPSLNAQDNQQEINKMLLQSPSFTHLNTIPKQYTCDGDNISPPLIWSNLPPKTASLVLIVDDPDAPDPKEPKMTWVHWLLYNISPTTSGLAQAIKSADLAQGTLQGLNDWQKIGYGGPCPPKGRHRYFHKLYALDIVLSDLKQPNKAALSEAMLGHILKYSELIGTYQRD